MSAISEIRLAAIDGATDQQIFDLAKRHGMRLSRLDNDEIEIALWRLEEAEKEVVAKDAARLDAVKRASEFESKVRGLEERIEALTADLHRAEARAETAEIQVERQAKLLAAARQLLA